MLQSAEDTSGYLCWLCCKNPLIQCSYIQPLSQLRMDSSNEDNQHFRKATHAESYTQAHGHGMHNSEFLHKGAVQQGSIAQCQKC